MPLSSNVKQDSTDLCGRSSSCGANDALVKFRSTLDNLLKLSTRLHVRRHSCVSTQFVMQSGGQEPLGFGVVLEPQLLLGDEVWMISQWDRSTVLAAFEAEGRDRTGCMVFFLVCHGPGDSIYDE